MNTINVNVEGANHDAPKVKNLQELNADIDSLADVASSGSYNDLKDKPTIPVVPQNIATIDSGDTLPESGIVGAMFFYTPDGGTAKPVWWNGTIWVDANGDSITV